MSHCLWSYGLYGLPSSSVQGILQERILEWVAVLSSRVSSQPRHWTCVLCLLHWQGSSLSLVPPAVPRKNKQLHANLHYIKRRLIKTIFHKTCFSLFSSVQSLSRVRLFATPWIAAHRASLSITNSWSSLRLTSIESVMPSSHLILCRPLLPAPNPSQHQSLFQWVNSWLPK